MNDNGISIQLDGYEVLYLLSLIEENTNGEQTDEMIKSLIIKLDQALPF